MPTNRVRTKAITTLKGVLKDLSKKGKRVSLLVKLLRFFINKKAYRLDDKITRTEVEEYLWPHRHSLERDRNVITKHRTNLATLTEKQIVALFRAEERVNPHRRRIDNLISQLKALLWRHGLPFLSYYEEDVSQRYVIPLYDTAIALAVGLEKKHEKAAKGKLLRKTEYRKFLESFYATLKKG